MSKRSRTLDTFLNIVSPPAKKVRLHVDDHQDVGLPPDGDERFSSECTIHPTFPFAIPHLTADIHEALNFTPAAEAIARNDQPDLDILYFKPYLPQQIQHSLFEFLRRELFFYRVKYMIKRGSFETQINTPRFTTVFGIDDTSRFHAAGEILDAASSEPVAKDTYKCKPRPIPQCLDLLRSLTENATGCSFNFALVNYYASGNDSISYHSDDERFLGQDPTIASFSLGANRDFLMKHKPTGTNHPSQMKPLKLPLNSGDMLLMRGKTQSSWLHSIPKRKGGAADQGRINITFRRAILKGGTENYYKYNVGDGEVYKWNETKHEMLPWRKATLSQLQGG